MTTLPAPLVLTPEQQACKDEFFRRMAKLIVRNHKEKKEREAAEAKAAEEAIHAV